MNANAHTDGKRITVTVTVNQDEVLYGTAPKLGRLVQDAAAETVAAPVVQPLLDRHGVTMGELRATGRTDRMVLARVEVALELRAAGFSLNQVGRLLDRDHTTILHYERIAPRLTPPDDVLGRAVCEDCDRPPIGGGRWCLPCFSDRRPSVVSA